MPVRPFFRAFLVVYGTRYRGLDRIKFYLTVWWILLTARNSVKYSTCSSLWWIFDRVGALCDIAKRAAAIYIFSVEV